MSETIWKNGVTQKVRHTSLATDYTDFTGTITGDALPGLVLVYSENRSTGWVDQVILNPVDEWNAENVAIWEAEIPASYITLPKGNATLQISGTGMKLVTIPLTIGTGGGGGGGGMEVFTITNHNSLTRQIDTADTTLTAARIKTIWNLTQGVKIYDSERPRAVKSVGGETGFDIQVSSGVIIYGYINGNIEDDDELSIKVYPSAN